MVHTNAVGIYHIKNMHDFRRIKKSPVEKQGSFLFLANTVIAWVTEKYQEE